MKIVKVCEGETFATFNVDGRLFTTHEVNRNTFKVMEGSVTVYEIHTPYSVMTHTRAIKNFLHESTWFDPSK